MNTLSQSITPQSTLADLAATRATASRVFYRHGLDFCCHGRVALAEAASKHGLAVDALIAELDAEEARGGGAPTFEGRPLAELIEHLLQRYHASHREELPRLLAHAEKVEKVHADKPACPRGLARHLATLIEELEDHMQKEEQVLFPMILGGRGRMASMPVQVLELEHQDHGKNLEKTRALAHGFVPPPEACGTWIALYLGLATLERDLMQHIHLENNVLFPRALQS